MAITGFLVDVVSPFGVSGGPPSFPAPVRVTSRATRDLRG
jgi:hypothetical protein